MTRTTDIFADDFESRDALINRLKNTTKVLRSSTVEDAIKAVDRREFVANDYKIEAYEDYPLPIAAGQTISQPTTVIFMLELLGVKKGDTVLDIGSGSGYTTALLSEIVGESGRVIGLEAQDELVEFGRRNIEGRKNAEIRTSDGGLEVQPEAPFDRILMSAGANEIPDNLTKQLKDEGVAVLPVKESIMKVRKKEEEKIDKEEYKGFAFVPFIE